MDIGGVSSGLQSSKSASAASVKVSESQEDQFEKVVGKILDGVDEGAQSARAAAAGTGGVVNTVA